MTLSLEMSTLRDKNITAIITTHLDHLIPIQTKNEFKLKQYQRTNGLLWLSLKRSLSF